MPCFHAKWSDSSVDFVLFWRVFPLQFRRGNASCPQIRVAREYRRDSVVLEIIGLEIGTGGFAGNQQLWFAFFFGELRNRVSPGLSNEQSIQFSPNDREWYGMFFIHHGRSGFSRSPRGIHRAFSLSRFSLYQKRAFIGYRRITVGRRRSRMPDKETLTRESRGQECLLHQFLLYPHEAVLKNLLRMCPVRIYPTRKKTRTFIPRIPCLNGFIRFRQKDR